MRDLCCITLHGGGREGGNGLWFEDDSAKSPRLATVGTGLFLRKAAVIALADPRVTAVSAEPQMSALGDLDAQVMDASGYSDSDER